MGDVLRFENLTKAGAAKPMYLLSRLTETGERVRAIEITGAQHSLEKAAKTLGVKFADLSTWFVAYKAGEASEITLTSDEEKTPPVFLLRGITQTASEGESFATFDEALAAPIEGSPHDYTIEWDSTEDVCCLDLDFHDGGKPDESTLRQCADTIRPLCCAWWFSRGGGLHLLYCVGGNLSADESAATAAVKLLARFPAASVELNRRSRRPAGEVYRNSATSTADIPVSGSGDTLLNADYSAWLEERGYEVGQRYPHEQCPVNPSPRQSGNTPPVNVYEDHIYCFSCNAAGVKKGSKTAGYFPLAVLSGAVKQSMFRRCAENFTHWGHAEYVVGQIVPRDNLARLYYRAALKQRHGDDPRIPLVFSAGPKTGLIRYDGFWAGESGRSKRYGRDSSVLSRLPVCLYPDSSDIDDTGLPKLKVSPSVVEELASGDDLSPYGYPALVRVWGIQLTQMQEQPADRIFSLLQRNGLPNFLPVKSRMPEDEAWGIIDSLYPGFNRKVVELLIVAKGCTEFRAGLPPMVFLTGPTGAGKTQSINLAASICGDTATVVTFSDQDERLRQGIHSAKQAGSFAFFDEYLKGARKKSIAPDTAMEFILNLTPDSVSHQLYTGPVPLGDLPVCCFADTTIPPEVMGHSQIARRVHHVPLRESKQWNRSTKDLRREGDEYVRAADSLVSHIMDRWFLPPGPTDFADVARSLGFFLFNSDESSLYKDRLIKRFFDLICAAPEYTGKANGAGWKVIDPYDSGDLAESWQSLADTGDVKTRLAEVDLRSVVGASEFIVCEIEKIKGNRVIVRFLNDDKSKVNGELV